MAAFLPLDAWGSSPRQVWAESRGRPSSGVCRKQLSGVWQAAVAYLERHETQLRAELQQVEGESWMVWRWLGPVSTPRAKVWQGRAFENSQGGASTGAGSSPSVGGLSTYVPATCLKIRNMFDPEV